MNAHFELPPNSQRAHSSCQFPRISTYSAGYLRSLFRPLSVASRAHFNLVRLARPVHLCKIFARPRSKKSCIPTKPQKHPPFQQLYFFRKRRVCMEVPLISACRDVENIRNMLENLENNLENEYCTKTVDSARFRALTRENRGLVEELKQWKKKFEQARVNIFR